jgi:hypothetical protein
MIILGKVYLRGKEALLGVFKAVLRVSADIPKEYRHIYASIYYFWGTVYAQ